MLQVGGRHLKGWQAQKLRPNRAARRLPLLHVFCCIFISFSMDSVPHSVPVGREM